MFCCCDFLSTAKIVKISTLWKGNHYFYSNNPNNWIKVKFDQIKVSENRTSKFGQPPDFKYIVA